MPKTLLLRTILIFAGFSSIGNLFAEISPKRKFQLDSITSTIDKTVKKDLEKVHAYLHAQGKNDEERVWLFFGFIATHFKYDDERKGDNNRDIYSAGYTTKKMSGVCEDFADLFKTLCDKSRIPCLVVVGKTPTGFFGFVDATRRFIHRQSNKTNHAWNIVKIDTAWKLMDPTWGTISRIERVQRYDAKLKRNVPISVKIVNRTYYATDPEQMKKNHKPAHPAFYASTKVPTFKTGLRKEKRQKIYQQNYPFAKILDSICKTEYLEFSKIFHDGVRDYASTSLLHYSFSKELSLPVQKTAVPLTIENYEASLFHVRNLSKYIESQHSINFNSAVLNYEALVNKKIVKLRRQADQAKANKPRR